MGLKSQLEWHEHAGGWIARLINDKYTRRYAHINIYDWSMDRRKSNGKFPVQFQFYKQGYDVTWHDSVEAAKLHVEAIFALEETDSLNHWR